MKSSISQSIMMMDGQLDRKDISTLKSMSVKNKQYQASTNQTPMSSVPKKADKLNLSLWYKLLSWWFVLTHLP